MNYNFAVFAYGDVGAAAVEIFRGHEDQLKFVLLDRANFWNKNEKIISELENFKDTKVIYHDDNIDLVDLCKEIDLVILAWWGKFVKEPLLSTPKFGFMNLHTSYLPYSKGKHPHYWCLAEDTPYGVTIMKIDKGLDTGDIIYQKEIVKEWSDTGKTLYFKGINEMCNLLKEKKEEIIGLKFSAYEQEKEKGTFHYGKEIESHSCIDLNKEYKAKDLLNIIRARTFEPFPAAFFWEDGKKYEVRITIEESKEAFNPQNINYEEIKI